MVFHVKCENSIKGVVGLTPFVLALVNLYWFKRNIVESIVILLISICISLFIMLFIVSTQYIVESECLLIVGIFGRKKILYQNIDNILKKNGRIVLLVVCLVLIILNSITIKKIKSCINDKTKVQWGKGKMKTDVRTKRPL